jgi:trehalose/maltose transport system permease protein
VNRARAGRRQSERLMPRAATLTSLTVISVFVAVPVIYMIVLSLSPQFAILTGQLIPSHIIWRNYAEIWHAVPLADGFLNSAFTAGVAAVAAVAVTSMAAYPLARYRFGLRIPLLYGAIGLQLVPGPMILLPLFVLFAIVQSAVGISIIGSYWGVMIIYLTFALPLALWLMVGYIATIPRELEEAVFIDGGGHLQALLKVVVPLAFPGMVVTFLFSLLVGWNDVLFATVLTNNDTRTLAVDLSTFIQTQEGVALPQYSLLMAAAVVASVPIVVVYLILQRYLVSGLSAGALK